MEEALKHKIPRLSDVVNKPSRHTVKKRAVDYNVETKRVAESEIVGYERGGPGYLSWERHPVYKTTYKTIVVSRTPIGEKLVVSRQGKGKPGVSASGGGRKHMKGAGSASKRIKGTAASRKGIRKGQRPKREQKKKGKKKR